MTGLALSHLHGVLIFFFFFSLLTKFLFSFFALLLVHVTWIAVSQIFFWFSFQSFGPGPGEWVKGQSKFLSCYAKMLKSGA